MRKPPKHGDLTAEEDPRWSVERRKWPEAPTVAHVVLSLDVGGLERLVVDLVREGLRMGHHPAVVCVERPGELAAEVEALGVTVYCAYKKPGIRPSTVTRVAKLLHEIRPHVIHTHQIGALFYAGRAARRAVKVARKRAEFEAKERAAVAKAKAIARAKRDDLPTGAAPPPSLSFTLPGKEQGTGNREQGTGKKAEGRRQKAEEKGEQESGVRSQESEEGHGLHHAERDGYGTAEGREQGTGEKAEGRRQKAEEKGEQESGVRSQESEEGHGLHHAERDGYGTRSPQAPIPNPVIIHTEHGKHYAERTRTRWLGMWAGRYADKFCCVSRDIADEVRRLRVVPTAKIVVVPNGIDVSKFAYSSHHAPRDGNPLHHASDEAALGTDEKAEGGRQKAEDNEQGLHHAERDGYGTRSPSPALPLSLSQPSPAPSPQPLAPCPVIGTVGRLTEVKRQDLLIRAFARLVQSQKSQVQSPKSEKEGTGNREQGTEPKAEGKRQKAEENPKSDSPHPSPLPEGEGSPKSKIQNQEKGTGNREQGTAEDGLGRPSSDHSSSLIPHPSSREINPKSEIQNPKSDSPHPSPLPEGEGIPKSKIQNQEKGTGNREQGTEQDGLGRPSSDHPSSLIPHPSSRHINPKSKIQNLKLLLVGEGPLRGELEKLAAEVAPPESVQFAGYQAEPERWLAEMDVFALTSQSEGMPVAILEAWAAGVPVVASAVGGVPELIADGETGLLFPSGDEAALAGCLERLLSDRGLASRLERAGRERVEREFSLARMADTYQRLYREEFERERAIEQ